MAPVLRNLFRRDISSENTAVGPEDPESGQNHLTDRGWRAWLAVVSGFIQFWAGFGMLNSWGTFQAKYLDEPWGQETDLSNISWIGSVQPGLLFFLGSVVGIASDKVSAGLLAKIGTALFVASFLLLAEYGTTFLDFLALQGFMYGIANTLLYYPVTSVVSDWFSRRRGLALGIISSGSSIGGIFWPMVVDRMENVWNLKRALQGVALIPLVPLLIASFMVKERGDRPKITCRDILHIKTTLRNSSEQKTQGKSMGWRTIAQPQFLSLSSALFFVYGGFLIPFNFIPLFAEYNDQDKMGNVLLAICYSGSFVGRIGTGALADRLGT